MAKSTRSPEADRILDALRRLYQWDGNPSAPRPTQPWPGTCDWILKHPKYMSWRGHQGSAILAVMGPPRSGKSVLHSFLFHNFNRQDITLSYCYEVASPQPTSELSLLRSLLWQLLSHRPELVRHTLPLYRSFGWSLFRSTDLLWDAFLAALQDLQPSRICCFVDGLDYCNKESRNRVFTRLIAHTVQSISLGRSSQFKLVVSVSTDTLLQCAISRIPGSRSISLSDTEEKSCRLQALQAALPQVVRSALNTRSSKKKESSKDWDAVGQYILMNMGDDLLWVDLVLRSAPVLGLQSEPSPLGQDTLLLAAEKLLKLPKQSTDLARHLVSVVPGCCSPDMQVAVLWVILTSGQISPLLLHVAIDLYLMNPSPGLSGIWQGVQPWSTERLQRHPLIEFSSSCVQLVHPSLQEELLQYLQSPSGLSSDWDTVARTCVSYLRSEGLNFCSLTSGDPSEIEFFLSKNSLYAFAATNWHTNPLGFHAFVEDIRQQQKPYARTWLHARLSLLPVGGIPPSQLSPFHVAAIQGLEGTALLFPGCDAPQNDHSLVNSVDSTGRTALHWAAELGHTTMLKSLVSVGVDMSLLDESGESALAKACWRGNAKAVQILLEKMEQEEDSAPAAVFPAAIDNAEKIRFLLECAASAQMTVRSRDRLSILESLATSTDTALFSLIIPPSSKLLTLTTADGRTPLHIASCIGNAVMVKWLLGAGADVAQRCGRGRTAIHIAVERRNWRLVQLLEGVVDTRDNIGRTALHDAVGWPQGTRLLIERGANPYGNTPLHLAVLAGSMQCFSLLLARSRDQVANAEGSTPADLAFLLKHKEMLNQFLHLTPSAILPKKTDDKGQSLLHQACEDSDNRLIHLLLDNHVEIDRRDNMGRSPLELLAWYKNEPLIKRVIQMGCDWRSVLVKAAGGGQYPIVELLLTYACGNLQDVLHDAWTQSVRGDRIRVSQALLAAGLGIEHKDGSGRTPLSNAVVCCATQSIQLLLARRPTLDAALHEAAANSSVPVIEMLLEAGANPNVKGEKGIPLYHAAHRDSVQVARVLLRYGADKEGYCNLATPLDFAIEMRSVAVTQLLLEKGASLSKCQRIFSIFNAVENDCPTTRVLLNYMSLPDFNDLFSKAVLHQRVGAIRELLASKGFRVETNTGESGHTAINWEGVVVHGLQFETASITAAGILKSSIEPKPDGGFAIFSSDTGQPAVPSSCVYSPLHFATWNGYTDTVRWLLNRGADANSTTTKGHSPLHLIALRDLGFEKAAPIVFSLLNSVRSRVHLLSMTDNNRVKAADLVKSNDPRISRLLQNGYY
ncbi:MAG: hypothetical protein M1840_007714 [Geoglossum simile]|nr:MAG: hypothetical protein M1840_007714 [Geoglossum simile]